MLNDLSFTTKINKFEILHLKNKGFFKIAALLLKSNVILLLGNEKNCKTCAVIYNFPLMVWQEKHNQSHLQSWKNKRREMTYALVKATLRRNIK